MGLFSILVNSDDESKVENMMFFITIALSFIGYVIYTYLIFYEQH